MGKYWRLMSWVSGTNLETIGKLTTVAYSRKSYKVGGKKIIVLKEEAVKTLTGMTSVELQK